MIYLECNADFALVGILGVPRQEREHSGNKGNVCNKLKKARNSKGLVDEDPRTVQPSYLESLHLLSREHEIKVLYDEKGQNYLIILCPGLEAWIIKAAKETETNMEKFGLPDDSNELHKIINSKIPKFVSLLEYMKQNSRMLKALERILETRHEN